MTSAPMVAAEKFLHRLAQRLGTHHKVRHQIYKEQHPSGQTGVSFNSPSHRQQHTGNANLDSPQLHTALMVVMLTATSV